MALPTSRNTTYAADSKVKSVDLNDLQDMIIGRKHATTELVLGPSAFQAKAGGGGVEGDLQWTFTAATELVSDITKLLPVGTRVVSVLWSYNRGGAGTITRRVRRRNVTTAAAANNISAPAGDATGAAQETQLDTLNHTLVTGEAVQLSITFDNAAHIFYGCVVTVDRL